MSQQYSTPSTNVCLRVTIAVMIKCHDKMKVEKERVHLTYASTSLFIIEEKYHLMTLVIYYQIAV